LPSKKIIGKLLDLERREKKVNIWIVCEIDEASEKQKNPDKSNNKKANIVTGKNYYDIYGPNVRIIILNSSLPNSIINIVSASSFN
jgi:hypothetical protein